MDKTFSNNIEIREMNLKDLELIKGTLETEFDDFWNYSILKEELESENSKYIVASSDAEIVGFAGIKITLGEADIMNIVTKKSQRNKGIASALLTKLIDICENLQITTIFLEVNEDNKPAISLYEKFEFSKIGIRKNYYQGKNGIVMRLG